MLNTALPAMNVTVSQYHQLIGVLNTVDQGLVNSIKEIIDNIQEEYDSFKEKLTVIERENRNLLRAIEDDTYYNPFRPEEEKNRVHKSVFNKEDNYIKVIFDVLGEVMKTYEVMISDVSNLRPNFIKISNDINDDNINSLETYQRFMLEFQLNSHQVGKMVSAIDSINCLSKRIIDLGYNTSEYINLFNRKLRNRHNTSGIKIHTNPVITDVAITVIKNTDSDGEIERGINPNEISKNSINKAIMITDSLKNGAFSEWVKNPEELFTFLQVRLRDLWMTAKSLEAIVRPHSEDINRIFDSKNKKNVFTDSQFESALQAISDTSPMNIKYRDPSTLMTAEEKNLLDRDNSDIGDIVGYLLSENTSSEDVIRRILVLKHSKRQYQLEVNSFFVCKIDSGNPFLGDAPGALKVIPGIKPNVDLSNIEGSGFDEAREFINQIDKSNKFSDLFRITSPSGKTDKTNVLLVGPQGCGKTEILRGVASKKGIIGVFAQASDFLTCWKGEMEKNPKRLFEASLALHKESNKNVFILIDEIDTILNSNTSQYSFGGTNLSTEFQVLMDGIMSYSGLGIWGATNHPDRLPTPILRRFAKVLIVGELNQNHRVKLLKRFCGHMPIRTDFSDQAWEDAAMKLNGAVGDIIRKVVDHLWREKMTWFVENHNEEAHKFVSELNQDGKKFSLSEFSSEQRTAFTAKLSKYVSICPTDLMRSIDVHLDNLAIKKEIEVCVNSYESAREYVASL